LLQYVENMIAKYCPEYSFTKPETLVAVSGAGNVAQFTALKVIELGATVVSLSDSHGSLIATEGGFTKEDVESIGDLKLKGGQLKQLVEKGAFKGKYEYHAGKRPWTLLKKVHIALPGATQNEVSEEEAKALIAAGCKIVAEGSNMGSTKEAVHVFEESRKQGGLWYAPGSTYHPSLSFLSC
jgi:glutamate dehydrogenase (NADP+)